MNLLHQPTMKTGTGFFVFTAFVLLLQAVPGHGNAKLQIRFDNFANPSQLKADGFCCDGERRGSNCTGTCDYSLQICLGKSEQTPCDIIRFDAGAVDISATGEVTFLSGLSNPLPFDIVTWQGDVLVSFTVLDEDTSVKETVDTFSFTFTRQSPVRGRLLSSSDYSETELRGQRPTEPTSLEVGVGVMCDRFYYSDNCSVNCVPSDDCSGHYDCDVITGRRQCLKGWGGDTCSTQLSTDHGCSADQVCEHGSTCVPYGNQQFYCCCSQGYTGPNCEADIDECESQPCHNGGSCSEGDPGHYVCHCTDRYKGKNCEESKTCADNPCLNGGRCNSLSAGDMVTFYCSCPTDYTGEFCEARVTTTSTTTTSTTTTTTPSTTTASCPENYYGSDCSVFCAPADDCTGHYGCDVRSGQQLCLSGWEGENCTIASFPDPACQCQNGGQCFGDTCCCRHGFAGLLCEMEVSLCAEDTCRNQGTCYEDASGFRCACKDGFTGERCETDFVSPVCPQDFYGPLCAVYCKAQDSCEGGQYTCDPSTGKRVCRFGWLGELCDQRDPEARHEVECPDSQCRNGGQCVNSTCCCTPGFTGSLCHIEILECASVPCQNGGRCRDLIADYKCQCPPEFTGKNCETRQALPGVTTTPITPDPCSGLTCLNNGTCVSGNVTGFLCLCLEGFAGELCQDSVAELTTTPNPILPSCPANYFGAGCNVYCLGTNACGGGHYYCDQLSGSKVCYNGWGGADCTVREVAPDKDPECPQGVPCLNGGSCFNGTCCCRERFSGAYCEVEQLPCDSSPCQHGTCLDLLTDYRCLCNPGYQGGNCQTFVGFPGSTATPGGPNATTEVTTNSGTSSTTSATGLVCGSRRCYNGGRCLLYDTGVYRCSCPSGYQGEQCEIPLTTTSSTTADTSLNTTAEVTSTDSSSTTAADTGVACLSKVCYNGATCYRFNNGLCVCPLEYTGEQCEHRVLFISTTATTYKSTSQGVSDVTTQSSENVTSGVVPTDVTGSEGSVPTSTSASQFNTTSSTTHSPSTTAVNQVNTTASGNGSSEASGGRTTEEPLAGSTPTGTVPQQTTSNTSSAGSETNGTAIPPAGQTTASSPNTTRTTAETGTTVNTVNVTMTTDGTGAGVGGSESTPEGNVNATTEPPQTGTTAVSHSVTTQSQSSTESQVTTTESQSNTTGSSGTGVNDNSTVNETDTTPRHENVTATPSVITTDNGGSIVTGSTTEGGSSSENVTTSSTFTTESGNSTTNGTGVIIGGTTDSGSSFSNTSTTSPAGLTTDTSLSVTGTTQGSAGPESSTENSTTSGAETTTEVSGTTPTSLANATSEGTTTPAVTETTEGGVVVVVGSTSETPNNETSSTSSTQVTDVTSVTPQHALPTSASNATTVVTSDTPQSSETTGNPTSDTSSTSTTHSSVSSSSPSSTTTMRRVTTTGKAMVNSGEIYITGQVSGRSQPSLMFIVENALNDTLPGNDCCSGSKIVEHKTFIDPTGTFVQKFSFVYVSVNGEIPAWSSETRDSIHQGVNNRLQGSEPFATAGNRVYTGPLDRLKALDDAYSLDVIGDVTEDYHDAIKAALTKAWSDANPDCQCSFAISSMIMKAYVGDYGTRLTHIYYFVTKDEEDQSPAASPAPPAAAITARFTDPSLPYRLYEGRAAVPFDLHYSLLLSDRVKMADSEGQEILSGLQKAWLSYVLSKTPLCRFSNCQVKVTYVRPQLYFETDGKVVSKLDYFVTVNGKVLDPKVYTGPTETDFLSRNLPVCACVATSVYYVDVAGSLTWADAQALGGEIIAQDGKSPSATVERTAFLDMAGSAVTRTFLIPAATDPAVFSPPDFDTANHIARDKGFTLVREPIRQEFSVALNDVISANDTDGIQLYIKRSWQLTNQGQIPGSEFIISVTDVDSTYFSDKSDSPVTIISYTVDVAKADSSLTIADQPSMASLLAGFWGSPHTLCACVPLRSRVFSVVGPLNPNNMTQIEEAIGTAWKKENPNVGGNLTVTIQNLLANETGRNGEELTRVVYTVSPEPGSTPQGFTDRDLRKPKNNTIETALKEAGFGVEVYTYSEDDDQFPWWIPVGIILGLLLLVAIIIIFIFIIRDQRRRRSRDIKQKLEHINGFDKEHFSSEPEFSNPTYAVDDPDLTDSKTGSYVVNVLSSSDDQDQ